MTQKEFGTKSDKRLEFILMARDLSLSDDNAEDRPEWLVQFTAPHDSGRYYRFLYHFCRMWRPRVSFEIGTHLGKSAAAMAAGNPEGLVITIDIDAQYTDYIRRMKLPNVVAINMDFFSIEELRYVPAVDMLFIDGKHEYGDVKRQFEFMLKRMSPGGVIFLDDINLNDGMIGFWSEIETDLAKLDLSDLHTAENAGFGAILV